MLLKFLRFYRQSTSIHVAYSDQFLGTVWLFVGTVVGAVVGTLVFYHRNRRSVWKELIDNNLFYIETTVPMVKYKGSYNGSYNGSYKYFKCRVQGCKTTVLGISVKSLRICGVLHFRLKQPLIESFTYHYK